MSGAWIREGAGPQQGRVNLDMYCGQSLAVTKAGFYHTYHVKVEDWNVGYIFDTVVSPYEDTSCCVVMYHTCFWFSFVT